MVNDDFSVQDRFLSGLEVRVVAFTTCDVSEGWRIEFPATEEASVHLVLEGRGWIGVAGSELPVESRSFVLIPAGVAYVFKSAANAPHVLHGQFAPDVDGAGLPAIRAGEGERVLVAACGLMKARHGGTLDLLRALPRPLARRLEDADLLAQQFARLSAELSKTRVGTRPLLETLLKQCMLMLLRDRVPADALGMPWSQGVAHPQLWRAFVDMIETMEASHSLGSLAVTAGMSRTTFSEQFAKAFGRPPMALLREMRLRRAAALLSDSTMPVETVARRVGYSSRSQFSRAFREFHGKDPRAFRS